MPMSTSISLPKLQQVTTTSLTVTPFGNPISMQYVFTGTIPLAVLTLLLPTGIKDKSSTTRCAIDELDAPQACKGHSEWERARFQQ